MPDAPDHHDVRIRTPYETLQHTDVQQNGPLIHTDTRK